MNICTRTLWQLAFSSICDNILRNNSFSYICLFYFCNDSVWIIHESIRINLKYNDTQGNHRHSHLTSSGLSAAGRTGNGSCSHRQLSPPHSTDPQAPARTVRATITKDYERIVIFLVMCNCGQTSFRVSWNWGSHV